MDDTTHAISETKECTGCGEAKPLSDYSIDKRRADGHQARCLACYRAAGKRRRAADPERARELGRQEYQRNRGTYLTKASARRDAVRVGPKRIFGDNERRFWSYVQKTETCWLWTGAIDETGYGVFNAGAETGGRTRNAHIWGYEHFVGKVPDGLELDHVRANGCTSRNCVNYESHLEPVTHRENMRRSRSVKLTDDDVRSAWLLVQAGASMRSVGRSLGVSHNTLRYRFDQLHLESV